MSTEPSFIDRPAYSVECLPHVSAIGHSRIKANASNEGKPAYSRMNDLAAAIQRRSNASVGFRRTIEKPGNREQM